MPRVRKGAARTQARKRILRLARGYYGVNSKHKYRAEYAVIRAGVYQFRDRRRIKRDMRRLWITRLTAACRMRGTRYSVFINGLKLAGIALNRKMLSEIAITDPKAFDQITALATKHARVSGGPQQPHQNGKAHAPSAAKPAKAAAASAAHHQGGDDIEDIEGIGPVYATKLRAAGLPTIKAYLEATKTKSGRDALAAKTGIKDALILDWANMADLMRVKGIGKQFAELLVRSGVDTVKELATRVPGNLAEKMAEVNTAGAKKITDHAPSEAQCAGWIAEAKTLPPVIEH